MSESINSPVALIMRPINAPVTIGGRRGKSAYQSYVDTTSDDPVLTEAEWIESLGAVASLVPLPNPIDGKWWYSLADGSLNRWDAAQSVWVNMSHPKPGTGAIQLVSGAVFNITRYGGSPDADAADNVIAFQAALDAAETAGGGLVLIDLAGTYELDSALTIGSNTELRGVSGVTLKKTGTDFGEVIVNKGAATRTVNPGITLSNFTLDVNDNETSGASYGMYGNISLYYVSDTLIQDVRVINVGSSLFAFHACRFERLAGNRLSAVGGRDFMHLGPGRDFLFMDCRASTYDDCFGAQPADYPGISPETGDIYNGMVIRCRYDIYPSQAGFFWRSVCGSWTDWTLGESYRIGRRVINDGNVYICDNTNADGVIVAVNAPTHTTYPDPVAGADGLKWRFDHACVETAPYWDASASYSVNDLVISAGKVYKCTAPTGPTAADNAPTHGTGSITGADGITWRYERTSADHSANCYNIMLIDCHNYGRQQMVMVNGEDANSNYQVTPGTELNAWMDNFTLIGGSHEPAIAAPFAGGAGWLKRMSVSDFTMSDNTSYPFYAIYATGYAVGTDPRAAHVTALDFTSCRIHGPYVYAFRQGLNLRIRVTRPTSDSSLLAYPKTSPSATGTVTVTGDLALDANSEGNAEGDEVIGYIYHSGAWVSKVPTVATSVSLFGRTVSAAPMDPCRYQMTPGTTATNGTGATAVVLDDERDMTAGTTATGYATCRYRTTWQTFNATSGSGINFDAPFTFAGRHIGCPEAAGGGVFRFLVGGADAAPALSTADAFATKGVGVEFGISSGHAAARLIYHNGTSYVEGDWVDLGVNPAATLNVAWAVSSLGNGTLNLFVAGAYNVWPTLPSVADDTVADGPTGLQTGQTSRFVGYAVVADGSTTPTANNTRALIGPIHADFTTP